MQECPICLDEKNNIESFPCGHNVCIECINLLYKNSYNECPLCRAPIEWAPQPVQPLDNTVSSPANSISLDEETQIDFSVIINERNRRRQQLRGQYNDNDNECVGNIVCACFTMIFVFILFGIISK